MSAQDFKTSAVKAFREHYDKLVDFIQEADLPVLGARFFCRQIISRETLEMVGNVSTSRALRVSKLMLAVMAYLAYIQTSLRVPWTSSERSSCMLTSPVSDCIVYW